MNRRGFGEPNLGAIVGAIVGSFGGLFAVGIPPAILYGSVARLLATPILALISWMLCLVSGWFIGGSVGDRLGQKFRSQRAEIIGGALGGLFPVILVTLWSWYMVRPR
jgi:hypothetical protein